MDKASLKITYLGKFSMKVCFGKLILFITNDKSKHGPQFTLFFKFLNDHCSEITYEREGF